MLVYTYAPGPGDGAPAALQVSKVRRSLSSYFNPGADAASASAVAPAAPSLGAQLERLAASGNPDDADAAYHLLDDCIYFNAEGHLPSVEFARGSELTAGETAAEAKLCGGMTQSQKNSRLDFLAAAVKGGAYGATSSFLEAGPFGDPNALRDRPNDPLVLEWKRQAIAQLTERADDGEIIGATTLMKEYLRGGDIVPKDPLLAYGYVSALRLVHDDILGPGGVNPYADQYWQSLRDALTPEQQAAALAKGNGIAAKFRQHTGRAAHS
ncbi:hypothetical protein ACL9RI_02560 [Janthinobacterium sp. Mn2066]|uniref:hypothetical protein n=1 Tax=Janthinobacterium sp. Mn2066 TaxID=3395264 RepID=UPI003BBF1C12